MSICLVDTSVFCEILEVPNLSSNRTVLYREMERKIEEREVLLLPMVSILETGNHIGQNGDGRQRRAAAARFVEAVRQALEGRSPFIPTPLFEPEALLGWLEELPQWVMRTDTRGRGSGLGDLMIVKEFERQCALHPKRRVYVWSLDEHLSSYDQAP